MKKYISLLLVLFLVSGCSFSFNMKNKEEVKEEKKEETSVNTVFYEAAQKIIVNDLLDLVSVGTCGVSTFDFINQNKLTVNDLKDDYKYSMTYYNLYKNGSVQNNILKNDLLNSYEEIFGIKPRLPEQFNVSHIMVGYGISSDSNYYTPVAGGGGCSYRKHYLLDNYVIEDNSLSFSVIYYAEYPSLDGIEKAYISAETSESPISQFNLNGNEITDADLEKVKANKDKFTQYRFIFKLNNDHYIFDSVEKIN